MPGIPGFQRTRLACCFRRTWAVFRRWVVAGGALRLILVDLVEHGLVGDLHGLGESAVTTRKFLRLFHYMGRGQSYLCSMEKRKGYRDTLYVTALPHFARAAGDMCASVAYYLCRVSGRFRFEAL